MSNIRLEVPNEVDRMEFYYKGTDLVDNAFTVCLLLDEDDKILSRGVSICSPEEPHCKGLARLYSAGRAIKALKSKSKGGEINHESRWANEFVKRKRKFKDINEYTNFVSSLTSNKIKWKIIFDKGDTKIIQFKIPRNHSLDMTKKFFDYKYEYQPNPHEFEIDFYNVKGN